jgi:hypothetical protein
VNTQHCSMTDSTRTVANNVRLRCRKAIDQHSVPGLRTRNSVQQRPHFLTRLTSSNCVRASLNNAPNSFCAEFGTMRPSDQVNVYEVNDQH